MSPEHRKKISETKWSQHRNHPLCAQLITLLRQSPLTYAELCARAGLAPETIWRWGVDVNPRLMNFEAALNVLGYQLKIERIENDHNHDRA